MDLTQAVLEFARMTHSLPDADLERDWDWGDYHEGVRFAFFRTYEELRQLATHLVEWRCAAGNPPTTAQLSLGQYKAAFRDLQAVLLGVDDVLAEQIPAEGEWPIRKVLPHLLGAERSFYAVTRYALERAQSRDDRPMEMPEEAFEQFWTSDHFESRMAQDPQSALMAFYDTWHLTVMQEFTNVTESELHLGSIFWESQPMPIEFRLHRFDSHLRQHTIQIEKTLEMLGLEPTEAKRLLRLIYAALAQVEGALLGAGETGMEEQNLLADTIHNRLNEVMKG